MTKNKKTKEEKSTVESIEHRWTSASLSLSSKARPVVTKEMLEKLKSAIVGKDEAESKTFTLPPWDPTKHEPFEYAHKVENPVWKAVMSKVDPINTLCKVAADVAEALKEATDNEFVVAFYEDVPKDAIHTVVLENGLPWPVVAMSTELAEDIVSGANKFSNANKSLVSKLISVIYDSL